MEKFYQEYRIPRSHHKIYFGERIPITLKCRYIYESESGTLSVYYSYNWFGKLCRLLRGDKFVLNIHDDPIPPLIIHELDNLDVYMMVDDFLLEAELVK